MLPSTRTFMWSLHQQNLMLLHTMVKEKMNLQENTLFDLDPKVTQNVAQCPLHHVTYAPTEFEVTKSKALGGRVRLINTKAANLKIGYMFLLFFENRSYFTLQRWKSINCIFFTGENITFSNIQYLTNSFWRFNILYLINLVSACNTSNNF